jgi:hypothetical protein
MVMTSPWTLNGVFRIKGNPNMVQVQFGPFSRPLSEREYLNRKFEPPIEELPWQGAAGHSHQGKQASSGN